MNGLWDLFVRTHDEDMVTAKQISLLYDVPLHVIYAMVKKKQIPHIKITPRCIRFKPSIAYWAFILHGKK